MLQSEQRTSSTQLALRLALTQIQSFKLTDLKLKNCLDFKADELRSGCMQAEENAESVAIFGFQACCPLYTEGIQRRLQKLTYISLPA